MPTCATLAGPARVIGGEVQKNEPRIASPEVAQRASLKEEQAAAYSGKNTTLAVRSNIDHTRARCHESQTPQRSAQIERIRPMGKLRGTLKKK